MEDPLFQGALRRWIEKAEYDDPGFQMIRSVVFSRIAKRQTPHPPGKKKRKS